MAPVAQFHVTLQPGGHAFDTDGSETILEAALDAGLTLPYGCRNGACGACKGKVVAGRVDHGAAQESALSAAERDAGMALFCCAKPLGDLVLECREVGSATDIPVRILPCRVQTLKRVADDVMILGLKLPVGTNKTVTATWEDERNLRLEETFDVHASQGTKPMTMTRHFAYDPQTDLLTCRVTRSTRTTGPEVVYLFKRREANNAYYMQMVDDWEIGSKLPEQACLISLQGIVNENAARLYLTFGPEYPFNYTEDLRGWLEKRRHFTFTRLATLEDALRTHGLIN